MLLPRAFAAVFRPSNTQLAARGKRLHFFSSKETGSNTATTSLGEDPFAFSDIDEEFTATIAEAAIAVDQKPMHRYRLLIEFEGTPFCGWAPQNCETVRGRSVHEALIGAIKQLVVRQHHFELRAAGRTDAGVHALSMVAHVDFEKQFPNAAVANGLNSFLHKGGIRSMCVLRAEEVTNDFHARFSALERRYVYLLQPRRVAALNRERAWHCDVRVNAELMHEAAQFLVGTRDMTTLRSSHCEAKGGPVRTITSLSVTEIDGGQMVVNVRAPSFLMHQVRSIVGCLVAVGSGKWSRQEFERRIDACDRHLCAPLAPPHGLYFAGARYPDFNTDDHRPLLQGEVPF